MGLFGTSKKQKISFTEEGDSYRESLKTHDPWRNVPHPHFKTKEEKESSRKKEIERNKRSTELYQSRAEVKRAKHSARHPLSGTSRLGLRKKIRKGSSGKMRLI